MMKLSYKPEVIKQLNKLPKTEKKKIVKKLLLLAKEPLSGKQLKGEFEGLRAFRAWPYRITYSFHSNQITIHSIKHRQSAYS